MRTLLTAALIALALAGGVAAPGPQFQHVYPLRPEEGVFAYARIAPTGELLAYASEVAITPGSRATTRTVTVVNLKTQKVLFTEPGIDAYWSNDGQRMIFLSMQNARSSVAIRHQDTGEITRDVAPVALGDYFSWAFREGKNLILTIQSNYYYLDGDMGVLPPTKVAPCPTIGIGDRPLISKDGRRITTFVRGAVVVRGLADCDHILDTGIQGGKADFSWDGRYVAFHAAKPDLKGYEIEVVDTERQTVRTVTNFAGSSLFPSWTKDGRLCFRYDGADYRGFMMADHVLDAPERPLPAGGPRVPASQSWADLFPETPASSHRVTLVMIWAPWSAHSPQALLDLQRANRYFQETGADVAVLTATELGSVASDVDRMRQQNGITLPELRLAPERLRRTEALNQIPTTLLFRNGVQVDRRLGAQTFEDLRAWVARD